ncbi:MAG: PH domain-containing protein, partial [Candidatus Limnocylindrales bacterium]
MSYADGLLSTGERVLHRAKQHPFIFIWGARYAIGAIVLAAFLLWFQTILDPTGLVGNLRQLLGLVTAVLFFGGLAVAIWIALRYINQEYVLTNRRVIRVEGVLNRNSTDSSLEKINDAVLSQSVFGRMFDFGDLTVLTASETGIDKMRMLRGPIVFKKAMLDAKHEFEVSMEREGWAPAPPIRDGAIAPTPAPLPTVSAWANGPGAAAATPSAAPAAPSQAPDRPRANPDEVTRTLANLADLRDRGAITPEEYEAKKADL